MKYQYIVVEGIQDANRLGEKGWRIHTALTSGGYLMEEITHGTPEQRGTPGDAEREERPGFDERTRQALEDRSDRVRKGFYAPKPERKHPEDRKRLDIPDRNEQAQQLRDTLEHKADPWHRGFTQDMED